MQATLMKCNWRCPVVTVVVYVYEIQVGTIGFMGLVLHIAKKLVKVVCTFIFTIYLVSCTSTQISLSRKYKYIQTKLGILVYFYSIQIKRSRIEQARTTWTRCCQSIKSNQMPRRPELQGQLPRNLQGTENFNSCTNLHKRSHSTHLETRTTQTYSY